MTVQRRVLATCMCLVLGIVYGGEFRRADVSASAEWVVHVNFDNIRRSQTGKNLLSLPMAEDAKRKLNSLKVLFGVDFLTDIKGFTAYGESADKDMGDGLVLLRARLERKKILAALQLSAGYKEEAYGKHILIHASAKPGGKEKSWVCFFAAETIVFARKKAVLQKGIDVLDAKSASAAERNPFADLDILEKNAMFMAVANLGQMEGVDPKARMLKHAKSVAVCVRENAGKEDNPASFSLQVIISGKTPEGSQRILRTVDGLIAMLQMGMEDGPAFRQVSKALDRLKVALGKQGVTISFQYPVDRLAEFVGALKKLRKADVKIEPAN